MNMDVDGAVGVGSGAEEEAAGSWPWRDLRGLPEGEEGRLGRALRGEEGATVRLAAVDALGRWLRVCHDEGRTLDTLPGWLMGEALPALLEAFVDQSAPQPLAESVMASLQLSFFLDGDRTPLCELWDANWKRGLEAALAHRLCPTLDRLGDSELPLRLLYAIGWCPGSGLAQAHPGLAAHQDPILHALYRLLRLFRRAGTVGADPSLAFLQSETRRLILETAKPAAVLEEPGLAWELAAACLEDRSLGGGPLREILWSVPAGGWRADQFLTAGGARALVAWLGRCLEGAWPSGPPEEGFLGPQGGLDSACEELSRLLAAETGLSDRGRRLRDQLLMDAGLGGLRERLELVLTSPPEPSLPSLAGSVRRSLDDLRESLAPGPHSFSRLPDRIVFPLR